MSTPRKGTVHDPAIGQRLLEARTRAGISQRALAAGTLITAAYISRIENGERTPQVRVLRDCAEVLGVSAAWLETGQPLVDVRLTEAYAGELLEFAAEVGGTDDELVLALMAALRVPDSRWADERAEVRGLA